MAGSNGASGNGSSAGASSAANTSATVRPSSGRGRRCPATWVHQASASAVIAARLAQLRPAKKLDRMYRWCASIVALSRGW